ncbi:Uncharacterized protein F36G3.2 [Toxocara canis]|uniref:Uncharacterized protein F36G3.2 n=1 Tax=Toxocara canis TaxID=6265 RepID=A0A0B2VWZ6_TOXCA|nr:Uncharacterized protein F36G3.2 [Toxocara canis]
MQLTTMPMPDCLDQFRGTPGGQPAGDPSTMDDIVIVAGKKKDFIDAGKASGISEGWVMCYEDYDAYLSWLGADKLRHAVAKTKVGEFIGCCMCLNMDDMAFVAMYYVRPKYRGKGIGERLFKTALPTSLMQKKNVGLHAAPKMSAVYDKVLGFSNYTAWKSDVIQLQEIDITKLKTLPKGHCCVKDVSEIQIDKLVAYDESVYKSSRVSFVQNFIAKRRDAKCQIALDEQGSIVGYGCAHLLSNGSPILCPIYCDSDDAFIALITKLLSFYSDQLKKNNNVDLRPASIKTPNITALLEGIAKVVKKGDNSPQFTKFVPDHDADKLYSVADLNVWI